jgi:hypothetical protein
MKYTRGDRTPWAVVGILLLLAVCIAPALADDTPQLPHAFFGAVSIQGQPAPVGTVITAVVTNGGGITVTEDPGFYGGMSSIEVEDRLCVHGFNESRIPEGSPISFLVNGAPAEVYDVESQDGWMASYPFRSGGVTNLDLNVSGTLHIITATAGSGGTITPNGSIPVIDGTDQTFNIVPDDGFVIDQVTVDSVSQGSISIYTFPNVTADHTIQATFTQGGVTTFTITASAGTGGSINPNGSVLVNEGTDKTFNIVPDGGFVIDQVTVDGSPQGNVSMYTFVNVTMDHTIQATFIQGEVITYTIEASAGAGGSIIPNGSVPVDQGNDRSFSIIPDSEFSIEQVLVDGESQGAIDMYTFQNVTTNHTIQATFSQGGLIYFNQTLESGWNLFSTPVTLDPGHGTFGMIFNQSLDMIEIIYGWDNEQKIWFIPANSTVPQPLDAYYVRVNSTAIALIYPSPSVTEPPSRYLPSGLSLIGSAPAYGMGGFPAMPVDQALISIKEAPGNLTGYTIVISPGLNQPGWVYALGGPLEDILPYKGYWVVMDNPDTLFGFSTTPIKNIG